MGAGLSRLDESLRKALLSRKLHPAISPVLVALCALFGALVALRLPLTSDVGMLGKMSFALLLAAFMALASRFALCAAREQETGLVGALLACGFCAAALIARVTFFGHVSSDYDIYLSDWMTKFASCSFGEAMRADIGEYNVLYQYLLILLTRLGVPALYGVKAISLIGDAMLAGAAARLCQKDGKRSLAAFAVMLLLPGVVINSGMFAQCDSLYAACALWGLAHSLDGKPAAGAACFALSLAFKLQACFLLPIVAVLWADRKLRLADALVFIGMLLLTALPALLGGKSVMQIVRIYLGQTGLYTGLNYGAANFFGLIETAGLDVYAYGKFGMALAAGCCMLVLYAGLRCAGKLDRDGYAYLSFLMVWGVVFFLPRMHERYFYVADALALVLAMRDRRMIPVCVLTAFVSLSGYWATPVSLPMASAMELTAGIIAICGAKRAFTQTESVI